MRLRRLALGCAVIAAIAIWDFVPHGDNPSGATVAATSSRPPTASPARVKVPNIPGVLKPEGAPEFTATFAGRKLDAAIWDTCYPWLSQSGCRNFGNANETEWYLPSQVAISGDLLRLRARRQVTVGTTADGSSTTYDCRSGMITSYPGFRFTYGYLQIIARIPSSPGLWPALWLDPASLKWPPEMDLIESWGDGEYAGSFFHPYPKGTKARRGIIEPASRAARLAHLCALLDQESDDLAHGRQGDAHRSQSDPAASHVHNRRPRSLSPDRRRGPM